jgi:hypothetical protein
MEHHPSSQRQGGSGAEQFRKMRNGARWKRALPFDSAGIRPILKGIGLKSALPGCPENAGPPILQSAAPVSPERNPLTPGKGVWLAGEPIENCGSWIVDRGSWIVDRELWRVVAASIFYLPSLHLLRRDHGFRAFQWACARSVRGVAPNPPHGKVPYILISGKPTTGRPTPSMSLFSYVFFTVAAESAH